MPRLDTPEFRFNWLVVVAIKRFRQKRNMSRGEFLEALSSGHRDRRGGVWNCQARGQR